MSKSRQALCSVTAVALLPENSSHKQEHIILSKEDLFNILLLINWTASELTNLLPPGDYRTARLNVVRSKLRYLSEVCEPPKDQQNANNLETT